MIKVSLSVLQLTALVAVTMAGTPVKSFQQAAGKLEAERLWELAIQAKGGRESLHAVRNIVISRHGRSNAGWRNSPEKSKTLVSTDETLYVFPDKSWTWSDWGDGVHLFVGMYNRSRRESWAIMSKDSRPILTRTSGEWRDPEDYLLLRDQLVFLMETQWVRPIPTEVRADHIGNQTVDVVRTVVEKYVVDFYLDQQHLPIHVAILDPASEFENKELHSVSLADYDLFDGIRLPRKVRGGDASYHVNVNYDAAIFEYPPSVEAGPEAWRPDRRVTSK